MGGSHEPANVLALQFDIDECFVNVAVVLRTHDAVVLAHQYRRGFEQGLLQLHFDLFGAFEAPFGQCFLREGVLEYFSEAALLELLRHLAVEPSFMFKVIGCVLAGGTGAGSEELQDEGVRDHTVVGPNEVHPVNEAELFEESLPGLAGLALREKVFQPLSLGIKEFLGIIRELFFR